MRVSLTRTPDTPIRASRVGSVVFEGDRVRSHVHFWLVLGHVDVTSISPDRGAQHSATVVAWTVELGIGRQLATRASELHTADTNAGGPRLVRRQTNSNRRGLKARPRDTDGVRSSAMSDSRPPIFDDGGELPDVDRSRHRKDAGNDRSPAGQGREVWDDAGDDQWRSPNYLVRRSIVVGLVVLLIAAVAIFAGRLLSSDGSSNSSANANVDWNSIVAVDDNDLHSSR